MESFGKSELVYVEEDRAVWKETAYSRTKLA
jgi:hypothetical protein